MQPRIPTPSSSGTLAAAAALLLASPARANDPLDASTVEALWGLPAVLDLSHTGHGWTAGRPDGHAPIGVMGDHVHAEGEWMVSYRYMRMFMDGNRDGTDDVSDLEVVQRGYSVTPTEMTMEMHMFGAMYAVSDDLTLMAMLPYVRQSMDHLTMGGATFTTRSEGLGDTRLTGLYTFWREGRHQAHFNAGLSVPTGSVNQKDDTPASGGADVILPYPMQLGSGTFDLIPGVTYVGQDEAWSWGAQASATFRLGNNERGYRLGNRRDATGWLAHRVGRDGSASLRFAVANWSDIHGSDSSLPPPTFIPTADPKLRGGTRADVLAGVNYYGSSGWLEGQRLALEFGIPVYQDLDGPQLETDWILTLGWQLAW